jgi:hypothetical protein
MQGHCFNSVFKGHGCNNVMNHSTDRHGQAHRFSFLILKRKEHPKVCIVSIITCEIVVYLVLI